MEACVDARTQKVGLRRANIIYGLRAERAKLVLPRALTRPPIDAIASNLLKRNHLGGDARAAAFQKSDLPDALAKRTTSYLYNVARK